MGGSTSSQTVHTPGFPRQPAHPPGFPPAYHAGLRVYQLPPSRPTPPSVVHVQPLPSDTSKNTTRGVDPASARQATRKRLVQSAGLHSLRLPHYHAAPLRPGSPPSPQQCAQCTEQRHAQCTPSRRTAPETRLARAVGRADADPRAGSNGAVSSTPSACEPGFGRIRRTAPALGPFSREHIPSPRMVSNHLPRSREATRRSAKKLRPASAGA